MAVQKHQFVIDDNGKKTAVILTIEEYEKLIEEAEELEAIHSYDAAKAANDQAVPFEQAIDEIERGRK
jgi:PHD/YefM family antitoxin component YafN of YafNO toxin-antitoxin module